MNICTCIDRIDKTISCSTMCSATDEDSIGVPVFERWYSSDFSNDIFLCVITDMATYEKISI